MRELQYRETETGVEPCAMRDALENRWHLVDMVGDVRVSTVFLGLDHSLTLDGPPVLWETMVFGGDNDQYQQRYTSRAEAIEGHGAILERERKAALR